MSYFFQPKVSIDATIEARLILLQTIVKKACMRYLCDEFFTAGIMPIRRDWGSILVRNPETNAKTFD